MNTSPYLHANLAGSVLESALEFADFRANLSYLTGIFGSYIPMVNLSKIGSVRYIVLVGMGGNSNFEFSGNAPY